MFFLFYNLFVFASKMKEITAGPGSFIFILGNQSINKKKNRIVLMFEFCPAYSSLFALFFDEKTNKNKTKNGKKKQI